jgi:stage IV sporulation protein FB
MLPGELSERRRGMRWSYSIGNIAGTEIKVHVTFLLFIAWIALNVSQSSGPAAAVGATLFLLALFLCIVLHEFGHILMARRFGVRTPDVILLPIGGVARLERIPDDPKQEFLIALAGPAVTLVIAALLYLIIAVSGEQPSFRDPSVADVSFLVRLMIVNVLLLLFNLIPAFPMDGGRVLRAILVSRMGMVRGTRVAATLGQMLALAGGLYGITTQHLPLILIAFFVFLGANAELAAVETRAAGEGLQVRQMMVTDFRTVPIHATLNQAVDLLLSGEQREFPVVDNLGRTEGILTRENLIRGLSQRGPDSTVAEAMTSGVPSVPPSLSFQEGLERLRSSRLPALPVIDGGGALVGLLTMDNITDLLLVRRARG